MFVFFFHLLVFSKHKCSITAVPADIELVKGQVPSFKAVLEHIWKKDDSAKRDVMQMHLSANIQCFFPLWKHLSSKISDRIEFPGSKTAFALICPNHVSRRV